jgi:DNA modification methylase
MKKNNYIYWETENGTLYNGECLDVLKTLPDESVNCVITSPPYWALRDYGVDNQLGLEKTFQEYITRLCNIFDEVKRVLRKDGTVWVVIGDTYSGMKVGNTECYKNPNVMTNAFKKEKSNISEKCLLQIPSRFAIEMCNRGWILRNEIIWYKKNCMPSSAKDRFTVDFEKVLFFVKNKKYWFNQQFEKHLTQENRPDAIVRNREYNYNSKLNAMNKKKYTPRSRRGGDKNPDFFNPLGRNKRTVWQINPKPFKGAHFAVFPPELIKTPMMAGCPKYICKKCGKARERIYKREISFHSGSGMAGNRPEGKWKNGQQENSGSYDIRMGPKQNIIEKGYTDCGCNVGFEIGVVMDIFMGSGTVGLVAEELGYKWIGIELNKEYCEMDKKRIKNQSDKLKLGLDIEN